MLEPRARTAIARLTTSVLSVKPLAEALAGPIRVVPTARDAAGPPAGWSAARWRATGDLLARVARPAGVPGLTVSADVALDDVTIFERVISERLSLVDFWDSAPAVPLDRLDEVDRIAVETAADGFDAVFHREGIVAPGDGVPLTAYCAGRGGETVVFVPACGMPAALAQPWLRFLARDRRVVSWESRGMFGATDHPDDYDVDLETQAADLFTVMDHYGVSSADVIGLCGGAVIALAAAAGQPGRISSLSLWHGAYAFASGSPRTRFQHDLIELMAIAAQSRAAARSVQATFCQVALTNAPADLAHFVLYPYATPELFYRYCRLNFSLASTDVGQYLTRVKQPTLVVTSEDDVTAHPQGSRQLADGLPNARLRVEAHGDHSSLFQAETTLMRVAVEFIAQRPSTTDCHRFV
jgi:pimeloyl-ACP methyl ester carboxylesterase